MGLALILALKVYTSVAKGLKLVGEGRAFCSPDPEEYNSLYLPTEFHSHSVKTTDLDKMDRILQ